MGGEGVEGCWAGLGCAGVTLFWAGATVLWVGAAGFELAVAGFADGAGTTVTP